MDERALQFRVGAMVVGTVLIAVLLLIIFNYSPSLLRGRNTVFIEFPTAPGVARDTPVRKSGVLIGRVTDVKLRDKDVLVTAKIDRKYKVYQNETCRIGTESLLGDSMIEFVSLKPDDLGQPITDGATLEGYVKTDPLQTIQKASEALEVITDLKSDVQLSLAEFRGAAASVQQSADSVNAITSQNEQALARTIQKTESAMDSFQRAMDNINSLLGDEQVRSDLQASLAGVPQLIDDTRTAVNKYAAVADRADRSLANAEKFTESLGGLGESSQRMSQNVDQITEKLDRLILDLLTMSDAINNQEGTLGQLVYNPELYQRLNRAADNVEQVSHRMRPIVEDVRVFSDKIARDPGRLGIKGIFERGQSGTKFLPLDLLRRQSPTQPGCVNCFTPPNMTYEVIPQAYQQPTAPAPRQAYPVQPNGYQPAVQPAAPQWRPTRPAPTTPQQFWQSR